MISERVNSLDRLLRGELGELVKPLLSEPATRCHEILGGKTKVKEAERRLNPAFACYFFAPAAQGPTFTCHLSPAPITATPPWDPLAPRKRHIEWLIFGL